ncbi:hypothetical protein PV327_000911 [Microctonus hyperodae]|uniref:Uncharacterized protein n=1 Tax=Microctonus hyperodae TaxID=165561 RepID=A0AA39L2M9_MICHY|nr:hypothetical protein PV327_000911 [Microctonus hyperodae]
MSSRKTRRGVKTENIDETLQDANVSKIPDTPDTICRTLRTRRQLEKRNSSDEDTEKSPKMNETKRQTRRRKGKDVGDVLDISSLNVTATSTRKRTRKDKSASALIEEIVVDEDEMETQKPAPEVSSKINRSRKRGAQKTINDATNNIDNDKNLQNGKNIISDDITKRSSNEKDNGEIENYDDVSNEDNEVANMSKKASRKSRKTLPAHRFLRPRSCNSTPNVTVTPECSPLTVSLTPHRTTKTPRKSPINIGSPKTHSLTPQRLSKTPRKIPVTSDSPATVNQLLTDGTPDTDSTNSNSNKLEINSSGNSTNLTTRRASNSPKAVQRTSKSKSPRKVSTKVKKSPNLKKSSRISDNSLKVSSPKQVSDSKLRDGVNESESPFLVLNRISPAMIISPQNADLVTPIVSPNAWKKLIDGVESPKRQKSMGKKRSPITVCGTPLRPVSIPKNLDETEKELEKSQIEPSSSTPTDPAETKTKLVISSSTPRERTRRSLKLSPDVVVSPSVSNVPVSVENFYGRSLKATTHLYNDNQSFRIEDESIALFTDDDSSFDISGVKAVDNSQNDMSLVDSKNEVKSITEKVDKSFNDTYELTEPVTPGLKEQNKTANDTYELDEPKTPGLGKRRNLLDVNSSTIDDVEDVVLSKRVCRVRFASPPLNSPNKIVRKSSVLSRLSTPANKGLRKRTMDQVNNTSINNSKMPKSTMIPPRRRSNSLTNISSEIPAKMVIKRRSLSVVDVGSKSEQKQKQNASVNRLSRPRLSMTAEKKVDVKTMSARKAPNFAQIHQKKFAKMESLVDAKKRVEQRHNALINNASATATSTSKTPMNSASHSSATKTKPSDAINGAFNRFGYRIRKEEAPKVISKQPPLKKTEEKTTEKRMALKGVRTNRRFELQMKMRNINP